MRIEKSLLIQRILLLWFWVMCCYGFINDELFGYKHNLRSLCLLFDDVVILLLALWTIREKWDYFLIGSFLCISWWSTCIANKLPLIIWINGSRGFFGMIFALPVIRYFWQNEARRERFVAAIDKALMAYLYVQAFCITWQFIRYGAGDRVGGSFGNGYSGLVSFSIYLASFYLMRKRIRGNHFVTGLLKNWKLIALLLPSFLNETKISFILVAFYFLLLVDVDRKWFQRMIVVVPLAVFFFIGGLFVYLDNVKNPLGEAGSDISEYLVGQDVEYEMGAAEWHEENFDTPYDVPRIAKISFIGFIFEENPENMIPGFGVGIYKGGTTIDKTPFSETYDWLVAGTTPFICHIVFQLGVVGSVWTIFLFVTFFIRRPHDTDERDVSMQLFFLMNVTIMLIYSNSWQEMSYSFFMLLFLTLSWVPKQQEKA